MSRGAGNRGLVGWWLVRSSIRVKLSLENADGVKCILHLCEGRTKGYMQGMVNKGVDDAPPSPFVLFDPLLP